MKNNLKAMLRKVRNYEWIMKSCFVWSYNEGPIQSHAEIIKLEEEFMERIKNNFQSNFILKANESNLELPNNTEIRIDMHKANMENVDDNNSILNIHNDSISKPSNTSIDENNENKSKDFWNSDNNLNKLYKEAEQISNEISKRLFERKDIKELQNKRKKTWEQIIKVEDQLNIYGMKIDTVDIKNQDLCEHCKDIKEVSSTVFQQKINNFQFDVIQTIINNQESYVIYFWDIDESNICLQVSCYLQDGISLIYSTLTNSSMLVENLNKIIIKSESTNKIKCASLDDIFQKYQSYSQNNNCKIYLQIDDNFNENLNSIKKLSNTQFIIFLCYKNNFWINSKNIIKESFFRTRNVVFDVYEDDKIYQSIFTWLQKNELTQESGIIYCNSSNESEITTRILSNRKLTCAFYHDKMQTYQATEVLNLWLNNIIKILVIPFETKLNAKKENIRFIISFGLPNNIIEYCTLCFSIVKDTVNCLILNLQRKIEFMDEKEKQIIQQSESRCDILQMLIDHEEQQKQQIFI